MLVNAVKSSEVVEGTADSLENVLALLLFFAPVHRENCSDGENKRSMTTSEKMAKHDILLAP